jgi:hypothetical protein
LYSFGILSLVLKIKALLWLFLPSSNIANQWLSKHLSTALSSCTITEEVLDTQYAVKGNKVVSSFQNFLYFDMMGGGDRLHCLVV